MDIYKYQKAIGQNIRRLREEKGLSQVEFAEALNNRGIKLKKSSLSRIENGERVTLLYELEIIAQLLNVPLNLICREADQITKLLMEVFTLLEKPGSDIERLRVMLEELHDKSEHLGDEAKAQYYYALGLSEHNEVHIYSAIEHYSLAVNYAKKISNSLMTALALQEKSNTEFRLKSYHDALSSASEALKNFNKTVSYNMANTYYLCGIASFHLGKFQDANAFYHQAELFFQSINDIRTLGKIKHNYAEIHYKQGNMEKAKTYYYEALDMQEQCGYTVGCCYTLQSLSEIYKLENNLEKAKEYLMQAAKFASINQANIEQASALYRLSDCYLDEEESYQYLKVAGELLHDIDAPPDLVIKVFAKLAGFHEKRNEIQVSNSFYRMVVKKGYEKLEKGV